MSLSSFETRLTFIVMAGFLLRLPGLERWCCSHYDEGAYVLAAANFADDPAAALQSVIYFAPPLYVTLVGGLTLLGLPVDFAAPLVSALAGSAAVGGIGLLGRRAFGPAAGLAAALLAAMSGSLIHFARLALTDSLFLALWVTAILATIRAVERPTLSRGAGVGLLAGLTWLTKYHGWLVLAVFLAASGAEALLSGPGGWRDRIQRLRNRAPSLLVALLIGAGLHGLWFLFVKVVGPGYQAVLTHQSGYFKGWAAWWPHLNAQWAQSVRLQGSLPWTLSAAVLAWLIAWRFEAHRERIRPTDTRDSSRTRWWRTLGVSLAAVLLIAAGWATQGAFATALALAGVGLAATRQRVVGWTLLAWWSAFALGGPLYQPYSRLWLPMTALALVCWGGWIGFFLEGEAAHPANPSPNAVQATRQRLTLAVLAMAALAVLATWVELVNVSGSEPNARPNGDKDQRKWFVQDRELPPSRFSPWHSMTDWSAIASQITKHFAKTTTAERATTRLVGWVSPAVSFNLAIRGVQVGRLADFEALDTPGGDAWVVIDHTMLNIIEPTLRTTVLNRLARTHQIVERFPIHPAPAAILDLDPFASPRTIADVSQLTLFGPGRSNPIRE